MNMLISGFLIGFSVAAPIGPVSMICLNAALSGGILHGFLSGLGAATADTLYGFLSAFGVSAVTATVVQYRSAIKVVGSFLILLIGIRQFFVRPPAHCAGPAGTESHVRSFASVFLVTLANPFTVVFFLSVFSAFSGSAGTRHISDSLGFAGGVFFGAASWWIILSAAAGAFHTALTGKGITVMRRISALIIVAMGLYAVVTALR